MKSNCSPKTSNCLNTHKSSDSVLNIKISKTKYTPNYNILDFQRHWENFDLLTSFYHFHRKLEMTQTPIRVLTQISRLKFQRLSIPQTTTYSILSHFEKIFDLLSICLISSCLAWKYTWNGTDFFLIVFKIFNRVVFPYDFWQKKSSFRILLGMSRYVFEPLLSYF